MNLWDRLGLIQTVQFEAQSSVDTGWNGRGAGEVDIDRPSPETILFYESGSWTPQGASPLPFRNVFRWTRRDDHTIRLEHLRFGPDAPVFLFDLVQNNVQNWETAEPHHCNADTYHAQVFVHSIGLEVQWTIQGPKKQEQIRYMYSRGA